VSAGVSLRVLPSIVSAGNGEQIRMDVHIEDGRLTDQQVGQLPVVSNSTIDTQALIKEGDSLLIAGYSVDQDDHTETAVPLLSKIPVIGNLFRYRKHQGQRFQRLFLLTPRVLSAAAGGSPGGAPGGADAVPGGNGDGAGFVPPPPSGAMNLPRQQGVARIAQLVGLPPPQTGGAGGVGGNVSTVSATSLETVRLASVIVYDSAVAFFLRKRPHTPKRSSPLTAFVPNRSCKNHDPALTNGSLGKSR
jgi:Type II secretory pathway, component PulD